LNWNFGIEMELLLQQMGAAASLCLWARRPAHTKAYALVFAWRTRESEKFYFAFAGGALPPLLLGFLRPARNPPLRPSNLSLPSRPFPFFFSFFSFLPCLLTNQFKKKKTL
jgi:hypothetical protein